MSKHSVNRIEARVVAVLVLSFAGCTSAKLAGVSDPRVDGGAASDAGSSSDARVDHDASVVLDGAVELDSGAMNDAGTFTPSEYQGFGAEAVGGSMSSEVCHVTSLEWQGDGTLYDCLGNNRTIVFDVGGTVWGARYDLANVHHMTIDGTTAPAPGITFSNTTESGGGGPGGDVFSFIGEDCHHNILLGVRTINAGNDGINVVDGAHDILIAHCTSYDNADGNIDIASGDHVTVQDCLMGPSQEGGPGPMLITSMNVTVHHNFFMPARADTPGERCPLVHCNYSPVGSPNADISNNLIWKFGRDNGEGSGFGIDIAYGAAANAENNYGYTEGSTPNNFVTPQAYDEPRGDVYAAGNVSGNSIDPDGNSNHARYEIDDRYEVVKQPACEAARSIIANAGAFPRTSREQAWLDDAASLPGCD